MQRSTISRRRRRWFTSIRVFREILRYQDDLNAQAATTDSHEAFPVLFQPGISEDLVYVREPKSITRGADTRNVLADAARRYATNRDTVRIIRTRLTLN